MRKRLLDWLNHRTGIQDHLPALLDEPLPASVGWKNTLGSIAGALLLVQILSGVLLMIYYVPHPDSAYESLEYVKESIRGGALVRALHHWGGSFIAMTLFLHIARVFFAGAYKKPRELTWIVGLGLFGLFMGLAFTGQLLPWNQSGYWAAKVGIEIAASAPVVGDIIRQLLTGGETVGALTLTRFYTLHVVVLPLLLGLGVAFHLYLLRRHGATPHEGDNEAATQPFYPVQLARDAVAISVVLAGLFVVAAVLKGPHAGPLDVSDTSYIPRPEWYFLSHFELLRYTPGPLKIVATFFLPNLLLLALVALPWLDRSPSRRPGQRRVIVGAGIFVMASIVGLTALGIVSNADTEQATVTDDGIYDIVVAGQAHYERNQCSNCHRIDGDGMRVGPDLSNVGNRLKEDYMRKWLKNPTAFIADTQMPVAEVNAHELNELVAYLRSLQRVPDE